MASLSLLCTIVGGGIVGLPFAFYQLGIPLGVVTCLVMAIFNYLSAKVYLKTREIIPGKPDSFYEIGYMLTGRISIYIVSLIIFIMCVGSCIVYFIFFGRLCSRLMLNIGVTSKLFTAKAFYKVMLGVLLTPLVLKKELKDMKYASVLFFTGIVVFMFVLTNNFLFFDWIPAEEGKSANLFNKHLWLPEGKVGLVEGLANLFLAFGYQQSLFPLYQSLREKTDASVLKVV